MSALQVVVAIFCLIASVFLALYVLLVLLVQAVRRQLAQLQLRVEHLEEHAPVACRVCGCTDDQACWPGGCYWVEPDLCSACAPATSLQAAG